MIQVRESQLSSKNSGWFLALGLLLLLLGVAVICTSFYSTIFSIMLLGLFLFGAGLIQIIQAYLARKWKGLFLSLLMGGVYVATGILCILQPATMATSITLWIAGFCFIIGLFRMLIAAIFHDEKW